MTTCKPTTPVIFRKDYEAEEWHLTAVFPTLPAAHDGNTMTCYAHIGQHGGCSLPWYNGTKTAKPEEYVELLKELCTIGYNLKVYRRMTPQHRTEFLKNVRAFNAA